ncbi:MAG: hypothetical protein Fur0043_09480 [Anaerolineales bacterium]
MERGSYLKTPKPPLEQIGLLYRLTCNAEISFPEENDENQTVCSLFSMGNGIGFAERLRGGCNGDTGLH